MSWAARTRSRRVRKPSSCKSGADESDGTSSQPQDSMGNCWRWQQMVTGLPGEREGEYQGGVKAGTEIFVEGHRRA
eukprot:scaffold182778_cov35-Tisochrysis_lutea.AAC.3